MSEERTAPQRIRITGLQESQLPALVQLEQACAAMYHEVGFDAAEVPPRSTSELARMPRDHNVHVAEADHEVAGYTAWRDEAPGVAYIAELSVHPDFQRFGIARRLWAALREDASSHAIGAAVVRCWSKAPWAMRFYEHAGFVPIEDASPEKVRGWRDDKIAGGRPLCRPGEIALWAKTSPS